jgi:hypothetical protein
MSVLLHPTLASKPVLATAIADRLGGVWEVCRGYCRLRDRQAAPFVEVLPMRRPTAAPYSTGPEAA